MVSEDPSLAIGAIRASFYDVAPSMGSDGRRKAARICLCCGAPGPRITKPMPRGGAATTPILLSSRAQLLP